MSNNSKEFTVSEEDKKYILQGDRYNEIQEILLVAGKQLVEKELLEEIDYVAFETQIKNAQFVIEDGSWDLYIYPDVGSSSVLPMKDNALSEFPEADFWKYDDSGLKKEYGGSIMFDAYPDYPNFVSIAELLSIFDEYQSNWPKPEQFNYDNYDD